MIGAIVKGWRWIMAWVWLVLGYGVLKGIREIVKKQAVRKSAVLEVLFFYTLFSFILVLPDAPNAFGLTGVQLLLTLVKSFVIFIGWLCGFYAIEKMPVSLYGVLDLSRMVFSTLLGVMLLGEAMTLPQGAGLVLVTGGLLMLRLRRNAPAVQRDEPVAPKYIAMALVCSLMNSVSATLDKILMRSMTSSQLQFWYMFFLAALYALFLVVRHEKVDWKGSLKNGWIWMLSLLIIASDRMLFIANGMAGSRLTIMTLLKQSGVVVTIVGGRLFFHEKDTLYKLLCAAVVIAGIVIAVL